MVRERLEVLHDRSEVELVACAGEAPQPHALEAMVGLQVRKSHLDPLALVTRFADLWLAHQCTRCIARILMHVSNGIIIRVSGVRVPPPLPMEIA
jgi:hypothetical protein